MPVFPSAHLSVRRKPTPPSCLFLFLLEWSTNGSRLKVIGFAMLSLLFFFCLLNVICCQLTWMEISFVLITVVFLLFGSLSRSNCVTLVEVSKCRCPGGWRTARLGMFCGMRKNLAPSWIGRNRKHVFWNVWNALFVVVFVLFAWGCLLKASSWCFSLFMLFFVLSQSQTCAARNGLKCKWQF